MPDVIADPSVVVPLPVPGPTANSAPLHQAQAPADLVAAGKRLRDTVPRDSHGIWKKPKDRADPIAMLQASARCSCENPLYHPTPTSGSLGIDDLGTSHGWLSTAFAKHLRQTQSFPPTMYLALKPRCPRLTQGSHSIVDLGSKHETETIFTSFSRRSVIRTTPSRILGRATASARRYLTPSWEPIP